MKVTVPFQILSSFLTQLVVRRHLIWTFVRRDLRSRYVGSVMGLCWSLLHPLVLLVAYTFVFQVIFQVRPELGRTDSFAVFLFCGLLPWLYFQDTLQRSCTSVVEQRNLIQKTLFPSEVLPLTLAASNLVTHLFGLAVLLSVLLYLGLLTWTVWLLPAWFFWLMLLALGLGWLLAALQVFLRDTAQVLTVLLVFWFWFTPIFYQLERVPPRFQFWLRLNPLTHVRGGVPPVAAGGPDTGARVVAGAGRLFAGDFLPGRPGLQGDEAGVRRCPLSRRRW